MHGCNVVKLPHNMELRLCAEKYDGKGYWAKGELHGFGRYLLTYRKQSPLPNLDVVGEYFRLLTNVVRKYWETHPGVLPLDGPVLPGGFLMHIKRSDTKVAWWLYHGQHSLCNGGGTFKSPEEIDDYLQAKQSELEGYITGRKDTDSNT